MRLTKLSQNLCIYQDKSVRESNVSASDKSVTFAELMFVYISQLKPSICCLEVFCTHFFVIVMQRYIMLKLASYEFLIAPVLSEGFISVHTPLRNSNSMSDSGLRKVS